MALVVAAVTQSAVAQQRPAEVDGVIRRNQSGGVNNAPLPSTYVVVSVDSYARTVRMRAADGSVANVHVGSDIYDISKLKAGDRIQVNFLEPDGLNKRLSAANIWPVR
jgi:hypothetical protein